MSLSSPLKASNSMAVIALLDGAGATPVRLSTLLANWESSGNISFAKPEFARPRETVSGDSEELAGCKYQTSFASASPEAATADHVDKKVK